MITDTYTNILTYMHIHTHKWAHLHIKNIQTCQKKNTQIKRDKTHKDTNTNKHKHKHIMEQENIFIKEIKHTPLCNTQANKEYTNKYKHKHRHTSAQDHAHTETYLDTLTHKYMHKSIDIYI